MQQSPGAGSRFGQDPKCGGYEGKQYNRHEHSNQIQSGQVLDEAEIKQSYQHPKYCGTSDRGDLEEFDMQNAAT